MTGDGLSRGLSDMWRSVVLFLPSALVFLAILIAGYLLARLARVVTAKTLRRVGFDRAVRRGPAGRLLKPGAPSATDVCARLAFFVVLLFAMQLAFGLWGPNPAGDLINALISWLPQVFVAIVIVVVTAAIAGAAHDLILAVLGGLGYARFLAKGVAAFIVTLGVIAGLDQIGIATSVTRPLLITVLATVAGVIIVGVGGGLIRPMQQRWQSWLDVAATESAVIRAQARAYTEERARRAAEDDARAATSSSAASSPAASSSATSSSTASPAFSSAASSPAGDEAAATPSTSGTALAPVSTSSPVPSVPSASVSSASTSSAAGSASSASVPSVSDSSASGWAASGFSGPGAPGAGVPPVSGAPTGSGASADPGAPGGGHLPGPAAAVAASVSAGSSPGSLVASEAAAGADSRAEQQGRAVEHDSAGSSHSSGAHKVPQPGPAHVTATTSEPAGGAGLAVGDAGDHSGETGRSAVGDVPGPVGGVSASAGDVRGAPGVVPASAGGISASAGDVPAGDVSTGDVPAGDAPASAGDGSSAVGGGRTDRWSHVDPAAEPNRATDGGGSDARVVSRSDADGDVPGYGEDDDWSWEARWAAEERRARESDGDETQVIVVPGAEPADDRPHFIPGFDRYDETGSDDEDDTIFVHTGTAETTIFTPGVRPAGRPAPDEEKTAHLPDPEAAPTQLLDSVPTRLLGNRNGESESTQLLDSGTAIVTSGTDPDETTVIHGIGAPATTADTDTGPGDQTGPVDGGETTAVVGGSETTAVVGGSESGAGGGETTAVVGGSGTTAVAGDEQAGADGGEQTVVVGGAQPGAGGGETTAVIGGETGTAAAGVPSAAADDGDRTQMLSFPASARDDAPTAPVASAGNDLARDGDEDPTVPVAEADGDGTTGGTADSAMRNIADGDTDGNGDTDGDRDLTVLNVLGTGTGTGTGTGNDPDRTVENRAVHADGEDRVAAERADDAGGEEPTRETPPGSGRSVT
jgi:hypothetical protein